MNIAIKRALICLAWLLVFHGAGLPVLADTTDPNLAGGPDGRGSRLDPQSIVLVTPPAPGGLCYAIFNDQSKTYGNSYFMPWNTFTEWNAFKAAIGALPQSSTSQDTGWIPSVYMIGLCCQPIPQELMDRNGQVCEDANGNPIEVTPQGTRYEGRKGGDRNNSGAPGDVTAPVSVAYNGNANIDYTVSFYCDGIKGGWTQTNGQGSCVPINGECALGSSSITTLPGGDETALCATGSIFGGFTNPGGANSKGPWTWTCLGTAGMANATCSSSGTNGACGSANGVPTNGTLVTANLCANGTTPSLVTGPDPDVNNTPPPQGNLYHWTCSGIDGSSVTASCSAPVAQGQCGNPGGYLAAAPDPSTSTLCTLGTPSAVTQATPNPFPTWNWTCNTASGSASCFSYNTSAPQPGLCGYDAGGVYASTPTGDSSNSFCYALSTMTVAPHLVIGTPNYWSWTCQGNNDGSTVMCSALYDASPGTCGPASGSNYSYDNPPSGASQLCSSGTPTAVNAGNGDYWQWGCTGSLGNATPCQAGINYPGQCGSANGTVTATAPTTGLCASYFGSPSPVTHDNGTWSWQCTGSEGAPVNCTASDGISSSPPTTPVASCGSANGGSSVNSPSLGLCSQGIASDVTDGANGQWVWTCQNGSSSASCSATNLGNRGPGICGSSNNVTVPGAPNVNLCSSGGASIVTGSGPWYWTCYGEGQNIGSNSSCMANLCQVCSGSTTFNMTSSASTGTINGCSVQGQSSWTETDAFNPAEGSTMQLQWSDPFNGTFTQLMSTANAPASYCPPCYRSAQSVTNAQVTVHATAGSCPTNAALNSGQPVTYTPTNVTLTAH